MIGGFYAALLGRAADAGGLAQFTSALALGRVDLAGVRAAIAGSPEAARAVAATYAQTLGRDVDADGLGAGLTALANGAALSDLRTGLGASAEAAGSLARAYEYQFGTAPSAATLATLQGELSRGKTFRDTARVDQRGYNHYVLDLGYTVEAQYSATGQASFIQAYVPNGIQPVLLTQSQRVPYDQSSVTFNPDRIVVDLYKASSDASIGVTFQLDGRYLGRTAVTAPAPTVPYQTAVDEITLIGPFGAGLHDLRITVDDPLRGSAGVARATFDGNSFLLGTRSTGASGSLDLFAHPGPQPPVSFVLKYPGL